MKKLIKKIETIFAAAACAEEGDVETAKKLMEEIRTEKRVKKISRIERAMMAIAFAEAGEHDTAIEIMRNSEEEEKRKTIRVSDRRTRAKRQSKERSCGCKRKSVFAASPGRLARA
jgi:hypothetical protein